MTKSQQKAAIIEPDDDSLFDGSHGLRRPILFALLALTVIIGVFLAPLVRDAMLARISAAVAAVLVGAAIIVRDRMGRKLDNMLFSGIFIVIAVVALILKGNINMEPSMFMFAIAISGLLHRPRTIAFVALMSTLLVLALWPLRYETWVLEGTVNRNLAGVLGYAVLFVVTGLFQGDIKRSLTNALRRIRTNERQLADKNAELQREVTERRAAELRAHAQSTQMATLVQASNALNSSLDRNAVISEIVRQVKALIGFDTIYIGELLSSGAFRAIHVEGAKPYLEQLRAHDFQILSTHIDLATMIDTQQPVLIEDVNAANAIAEAKRRRMIEYFGAVPEYSQSSMSAPLVTGGRVTGVLIVNSAKPGNYTPDMSKFISAIAGMISTSIERARLHDKSLEAATLTERGRIARELHDSVSQSLFGIVLGLRTMDASNTLSREAFDYVFQLAEAALSDTRALVFELRPEYLEREGLIAALKKQASTVCTRHNVNAYLDLGHEEPQLPLAEKEALYRIAIEAVQNAIKHAQASIVRLELRTPPGELFLSITDNGIGFDTNHDYAGHFGLRTMRERADAIGGRCSVLSKPGFGATILVTLPLNRWQQSDKNVTYQSQAGVSVATPAG
jgi:signal transduction histidine kinase